MIHRRNDPGAIVIGNFVYAIGGGSQFKPKRSCEKYNIQENKWERIASLNIE